MSEPAWPRRRRLWAAARFPYLASGIFGAQVTAVPGLDSVAIDQRWQLSADPGWWPADPPPSSAAFSCIMSATCCVIIQNGRWRLRSPTTTPGSG